jgi:hypothetical protein
MSRRRSNSGMQTATASSNRRCESSRVHRAQEPFWLQSVMSTRGRGGASVSGASIHRARPPLLAGPCPPGPGRVVAQSIDKPWRRRRRPIGRPRSSSNSASGPGGRCVVPGCQRSVNPGHSWGLGAGGSPETSIEQEIRQPDVARRMSSIQSSCLSASGRCCFGHGLVRSPR